MIKVHIVCPDDRHILPRMYSWVRDSLGWSMSERPDKSADVNFYAPYLAIHYGIVGKTAAWFTHKETGNPGKMGLWHQASNQINLPCVTSGLYLNDFGSKPVHKLTPGIDTDHFKPAGRVRSSKIIGLVGVGQARKGNDLAARLVAQGLTVKAAGKDWVIPCEWVGYEDMPAFYNTIGVYVCTATIEGIPAPPLEALACGVKVVIPSGVGVMDELPETEGVRHYRAGDYDDLLRALVTVQADKVKASDLRALVSGYTVKAWCDSHADAIERMP